MTRTFFYLQRDPGAEEECFSPVVRCHGDGAGPVGFVSGGPRVSGQRAVPGHPGRDGTGGRKGLER